MQHGQVLELPVILEVLPSEALVELCNISRSIHGSCLSQLRKRTGDITLNPEHPVADFIRLMSVRPDFVVRGVERFIGLDEALYRASLTGNRYLINYFLRSSPEADKGCNSRHIMLILLGSLLSEDAGEPAAVGREIIYNCPLNIPSLERLNIIIKALDLEPKFYIPYIKTRMTPGIPNYDSPSLIRRLKSLENPGEILESAAQNGNLRVFKYMEHGHEPDYDYLLEQAAAYDRMNIVKYITDNHLDRLDVNAIDRAFHLVIESDNLDAVEYFIHSYYVLDDFLIQDVMENAVTYQSLNIIDYLLLKRWRSIDEILENAVVDGSVRVIAHLIREYSVDPQHILEDAVGEYDGKLEVVKYLVEDYRSQLNLTKTHELVKEVAKFSHSRTILEIDKYLSLVMNPEVGIRGAREYDGTFIF